MARKKKQAQSTSRPAPAATVIATAAAPAGDDGPRPAQSLAGTSRSAADGDATSVASRVAAECAAILRDINRGARQVSLAPTYRQRGGPHPRPLVANGLFDKCPPRGLVRRGPHLMRATPHACMVHCEILATDAPSPFRHTLGGPQPTRTDACCHPPARRPKGKKALQKLAKDYPPSALPFRYLVRFVWPAVLNSDRTEPTPVNEAGSSLHRGGRSAHGPVSLRPLSAAACSDAMALAVGSGLPAIAASRAPAAVQLTITNMEPSRQLVQRRRRRGHTTRAC